MDREILFRGTVSGKRLNKGEWIEGNLVHQLDYYGKPCDKYFILNKYDTNDYEIGEPIQVDPATVGQFTGLCDKNGVKIFEGDILTTDLFRPYVVVIFRDGCFMFNCNDGGKDYWDIMLPIMKEAQTQTLYHEVIGNIYDNPELLEGIKDDQPNS